MELLDIYNNRYSNRSFDKQEVENELIEKIINAGLKAPTAHNNEPCKIRIIKSEEALEKLRKSTECHYDAPLAFLITFNKQEQWIREYDNKTSGDIDSTIITTYMMLEAESLGLRTCLVMYFIPGVVRKEFELKDNEEPSLFLLVGYPSQTSKPSHLHFEKKNKQDIIKEV